jgi:hypothetical protein
VLRMLAFVTTSRGLISLVKPCGDEHSTVTP